MPLFSFLWGMNEKPNCTRLYEGTPVIPRAIRFFIHTAKKRKKSNNQFLNKFIDDVKHLQVHNKTAC